MYLYSRLQWLKTVTADGAQPAREALDVLEHKFVLFQVNVVKASTAGEILFETAMVRDARRFVTPPNAPPTVDLTAVGVTVIELWHPFRYVRWVVDGIGSEAVFQIDVIARPQIPPP